MVNPLQRITGMILRPTITFAEAKDDPLDSVSVPYLLIALLGLLVKLLTPADAFSFLPGSQTILEFEALFTFLTALAGALAGTGILAIITRIAGKRQTLWPAARVFLSAIIPLLLCNLLVNVMLLSGYLGFSPARAVAGISWIFMILVCIWTIVLLVIGLEVLFGMPAPRAALCSVAALAATFLAVLAMTLPVAGILAISEPGLLTKLQLFPVVMVGIFGCYGILEEL